MEVIQAKRQTSFEQLSSFFSSWQFVVEKVDSPKTLFVLATENIEEVSFLLRKMRSIGQIKKIDHYKDLLEQTEKMSTLFLESPLKTSAYFLDLKNVSDIEIDLIEIFLKRIDSYSSIHVIVSAPKPLKGSFSLFEIKCLDWSSTQSQKVRDRYFGLAYFLARHQDVGLDMAQANDLAYSFKNDPYGLENELIKFSLGFPQTSSGLSTGDIWEFFRKIEKREWRPALEMIDRMDNHPDTANRWVIVLRKHLSQLLVFQLGGFSISGMDSWKEKRRQMAQLSLKRIGKTKLLTMVCTLGSAEAAVRLGEASPKEALQAWILGLAER